MKGTTAIRTVVRAMRLTDIRGVRRLWKRTVGVSRGDTRKGIARFLRRNRGMSFVVLAGGRVVGAILAGHDGRRGYLYHMAVDEGYRRRGFGMALAKKVIAAFRRAGIPRIHLFIRSKNRVSRAFWKRVGWELFGDIRFMSRQL